jgi:hypothetical protein
LENTETARTCSECGCELSYPWITRLIGEGFWLVLLRCPNCSHGWSRMLTEDGLEDLERALDLDARAMAAELSRLNRANMAEEIEHFVTALEVDGILPMDF